MTQKAQFHHSPKKLSQWSSTNLQGFVIHDAKQSQRRWRDFYTTSSRAIDKIDIYVFHVRNPKKLNVEATITSPLEQTNYFFKKNKFMTTRMRVDWGCKVTLLTLVTRNQK